MGKPDQNRPRVAGWRDEYREPTVNYASISASILLLVCVFQQNNYRSW
jgi:hypothetical protein